MREICYAMGNEDKLHTLHTLHTAASAQRRGHGRGRARLCDRTQRKEGLSGKKR